MSLYTVPLTLKEANAMIAELHRHHEPVVGHRFSIGVIDQDGQPRGAAVVGRPVARMVDSKKTAEVTRLVTDGTKNACSALYGAAARAAQAMGFERIQTYILQSEPGTSLLAAGWTCEGTAGGGSWSREGRERTDSHPTELKTRWGRQLNAPRPVAVLSLVAA